MRIERIQLRNFRCFEALDLELHPRVTLLVGVNGSGKTSVLDGLAVALGSWFLGFPDVAPRPIARDEMRRVKIAERSGSGETPPSLEIAGPTRVAATGTVLDEEVTWARELGGLEGQTSTGEANELRQLAERAAARVPTAESNDLPVLAYYGTGRLWAHQHPRHDRPTQLGSLLEGYDACLEPASNHELLEAWMAWREQARIESIARALEEGGDGTRAREPAVEAVARAAESCVDGAKRFYYSLNHRELRIDFHDGRTLPFRMLSDGYRNLLALAADIAWRSARLNPHFGADAARRATGVVLIDEVDLHLHPRWQRQVLPDLHRAFPNIQFIATTHSPQVISAAPAQWLRALDPNGGPPRRVEHTLGRDSNSLLEDILGVPGRPEDMTGALQHLFDLIDQGALLEAEQRWQALRDELGPHDPEIVRARTILDLEHALPRETGS